ncbi:MAG: hypothetical protein ABWW65_01315 [Thermoprotei archaeon]
MIDKEILRYYIELRSREQPLGVREVQRILGFNSPGKAHRLLKKLVRYGLAERLPGGKYRIIPDPPPELIGKIIIRGRVLPKILVIGVYVTVLTTTYILLANPPIDVILLLILVNTPIWIEALNEYRELKRKLA